jgi:hypothetical protein
LVTGVAQPTGVLFPVQVDGVGWVALPTEPTEARLVTATVDVGLTVMFNVAVVVAVVLE